MNSGSIERKNAPLISVVLPVFNAEKYVTEAIQSILDQTFGNFELILINDGSTDGTLKILEAFRNNDKRVVLISRENKGLVESLNEGVGIARGEWIARMDADDIALPQRFERQLQWLEDTRADVCGSWFQVFGAKSNDVRKHPVSDEAIKFSLLFGSFLAHPTVIMKTSLIKVMRYDPAWDKAEDYELWVRAALAGWKMANVPEVLLLYRQHGNQISTASASRQKYLTQKIRRHYWEEISYSIRLNSEWVEEVLSLSEVTTQLKPNMDYVDLAFSHLLQICPKEIHSIILEYASILYLKVAANCPNIIARWCSLTKRYRCFPSIKLIAKLWIVSAFYIVPGSKLWIRLKKMYFYFSKS